MDGLNEIKRIREVVNNIRWPETGEPKDNYYKEYAKAVIIGTSINMIQDAFSNLKDLGSYPKNQVTLFGILQLLYVQQDAVKELNKVFYPVEYKHSETITEIREVRNNVIGHPVIRTSGKAKGSTITDFKPTFNNGWNFQYLIKPKVSNKNLNYSFVSKEKELDKLVECQFIDFSEVLKNIQNENINNWYEKLFMLLKLPGVAPSSQRNGKTINDIA